MSKLWSILSWDISKQFCCLSYLFQEKVKALLGIAICRGLQSPLGTEHTLGSFVFPQVYFLLLASVLFYCKRISPMLDSRNQPVQVGCWIHKIIITWEQTPRAMDKGILTNWNINKYQLNNSGSHVAIYFLLPEKKFFISWVTKKTKRMLWFLKRKQNTQILVF